MVQLATPTRRIFTSVQPFHFGCIKNLFQSHPDAARCFGPRLPARLQNSQNVINLNFGNRTRPDLLAIAVTQGHAPLRDVLGIAPPGFVILDVGVREVAEPDRRDFARGLFPPLFGFGVDAIDQQLAGSRGLLAGFRQRDGCSRPKAKLSVFPRTNRVKEGPSLCASRRNPQVQVASIGISPRMLETCDRPCGEQMKLASHGPAPSFEPGILASVLAQNRDSSSPRETRRAARKPKARATHRNHWIK